MIRCEGSGGRVVCAGGAVIGENVGWDNDEYTCTAEFAGATITIAYLKVIRCHGGTQMEN